MTGIYRIVHTATGREYIGQAADISQRWRAHRRRLTAGNHHAPHLQSAWAKYGATAFMFEMLEECAVAELDAREQHWLDSRCPAFNTAKIAGTRRGVPHSPASKAKLSAALTGRKRSPAECAAIAAGQRGKTHSEAAKAKMRAAATGRAATAAARNNMSQAQRERGRPTSEYDSRRGRRYGAARVEKSALARRGAQRTPEQKEKMRQAALAMSPDKRAKIAQARRDAIATRSQGKELR